MVGNTLGTSWEHIKNNKKPTYAPTLPPKVKKKPRPLGVMLPHLIDSKKKIWLLVFSHF